VFYNSLFGDYCFPQICTDLNGFPPGWSEKRYARRLPFSPSAPYSFFKFLCYLVPSVSHLDSLHSLPSPFFILYWARSRFFSYNFFLDFWPDQSQYHLLPSACCKSEDFPLSWSPSPPYLSHSCPQIDLLLPQRVPSSISLQLRDISFYITLFVFSRSSPLLRLMASVPVLTSTTSS